MKLQILLATYNSEKFLREQLDSILAQDHQDFQLLMRDAGSTDSTLDIIKSYVERYPEKIFYIGQSKDNACRNFSHLLAVSDADLIMFSDHDDVWMPDKISRTLNKYMQAEKVYGKECPILVFTDSAVTDKNLNILNNSMFSYQKLDPENTSFIRLTVQNTASGNSMLINRSLKELAVPLPQEAVMHDHYLMLTAAAMGKIILLNEPTLLYRQHDDNVFGAADCGVFYFLRKLLHGRKNIVQRFNNNIIQAEAFYLRNQGKLPLETEKFLSELAAFRSLGIFAKRRFLLRWRMFKCGFLRNVGMFLVI